MKGEEKREGKRRKQDTKCKRNRKTRRWSRKMSEMGIAKEIKKKRQRHMKEEELGDKKQEDV